ncbi:MAG: DUF3237 domain-containing protein [Butyrivibrio sp.]|nr:DUF3237 domain-containing protein [Butyrivibrio sp.]
MNELLTIEVNLKEIIEVKGGEQTARMILFDGKCDSPAFKGIILPGGVDTQIETGETDEDIVTSLSARYIMDGTDSAGEKCRIFIENNGTGKRGDEVIAYPKITTDSKALSYLEKADLVSKVEGRPGGVIIHIFEK